MSTNYIIASSANTLKRRLASDSYSHYVLQYHLQILDTILDSTTHITQVTICRQESTDPKGIYYDIDSYIKKIENKGVKVVILDLPNEGISYYQYIQAFRAFPDFDYYLIMEDDWVLNTSYINIDTIFIEYYKKAFPNNIGFLNCWSPISGKFIGENGGRGDNTYHSAITLGLLSKESINIFNTYSNPQIGQVLFSNILLTNNINIIDFPQVGLNTRILFWETSDGCIRDFTESKSPSQPLFVPVQFYYKTIKYKNMIHNNIYYEYNNKNIFNQV